MAKNNSTISLSTKTRIYALAGVGLSCKFIQQHIKGYEGKIVSRVAISRVLRDYLIRITDYRDGLTNTAEVAAHNACIRAGLHMTPIKTAEESE